MNRKADVENLLNSFVAALASIISRYREVHLGSVHR
jgi:hypothetical protein